MSDAKKFPNHHMPKESTDFGAEITPGSSKETAGWAPKSKTHSIPEATKGHPFNSVTEYLRGTQRR